MTTNEYRLGGAGGYSVFGYGHRTTVGPVYTKIIIKCDDDGRLSKDVTTAELPIWLRASAVDILHLDSLIRSARKHLAMGVKR